MAQMTPEVSKLLEKALSLSLEEQEALADSLISNLGGKVDEGLQAAWEAEIRNRVSELESGKAKTVSWPEVRRRETDEPQRGERSVLTHTLAALLLPTNASLYASRRISAHAPIPPRSPSDAKKCSSKC